MHCKDLSTFHFIWIEIISFSFAIVEGLLRTEKKLSCLIIYWLLCSSYGSVKTNVFVRCKIINVCEERLAILKMFCSVISVAMHFK